MKLADKGVQNSCKAAIFEKELKQHILNLRKHWQLRGVVSCDAYVSFRSPPTPMFFRISWFYMVLRGFTMFYLQLLQLVHRFLSQSHRNWFTSCASQPFSTRLKAMARWHRLTGLGFSTRLNGLAFWFDLKTSHSNRASRVRIEISAPQRLDKL